MYSMNHFIEWSRNIINQLMLKQKNKDYLYSLKIILEPNPLDCDGKDEVEIRIIEKNRKLQSQKLFWDTGICDSLDEAIEKVNNFIK